MTTKEYLEQGIKEIKDILAGETNIAQCTDVETKELLEQYLSKLVQQLADCK